MIPGFKTWRLVLLLALSSISLQKSFAQELRFQSPLPRPPTTNAPGSPASAALTDTSPPLNASETALLKDAVQLLEQNQLDAALAKANAVIKLSPRNAKAYAIRASIYSEEKQWDPAKKDYQTILQIDGGNTSARFNLNELKFRQKQYDDARYGFIALQEDDSVSDLASYKVFLCDLFGGHENMAAKELEAFDEIGSNPSYYYANAAWFLFHHQNDAAKTWLDSALHIYAPIKNQMYAASLIDLGYLVTPPSAPNLPPPN